MQRFVGCNEDSSDLKFDNNLKCKAKCTTAELKNKNVNFYFWRLKKTVYITRWVLGLKLGWRTKKLGSKLLVLREITRIELAMVTRNILIPASTQKLKFTY